MNKLAKWGVAFASALGFGGSAWAVTPYDALIAGVDFSALQTNVLLVIGLLIAFALVVGGGQMLYHLIKRNSSR
jgi:hypothetical protein